MGNTQGSRSRADKPAQVRSRTKVCDKENIAPPPPVSPQVPVPVVQRQHEQEYYYKSVVTKEPDSLLDETVAELEILQVQDDDIFSLDLESSDDSILVDAPPATEALLSLSKLSVEDNKGVAFGMLDMAVTCLNKESESLSGTGSFIGEMEIELISDSSKQNSPVSPVLRRVLLPSRIPIFVGPGSKFWRRKHMASAETGYGDNEVSLSIVSRIPRPVASGFANGVSKTT